MHHCGRNGIVGYGRVVPALASSDTTAPTPNPTTWAIPPTVVGNAITMTATTASDPSGVQYYFDEVSGNGHSSVWQDSPTYTDAGLTNLTYVYRVKVRDKSPNHNETAYSASVSAYPPDATPPTPNPATWATVPFRSASGAISMTATTASDSSGIQYITSRRQPATATTAVGRIAPPTPIRA